MDTTSNTIIPKYYPATYIWLLFYVVGFVALMTFPFIRSAIFPGEEYWVGFYWGIGFGLAALYEGGKLIRVIEFGDDEIVLYRRLWGRKSILYREIRKINIEWSYIDAKGAKIHFYGMVNQEELLKKVTDTLSEKNILDISLREEEKKSLAVVYKRLRYALILTVAIGLVAEFVGNTDWSSFYIILILYFVLIYQVLRFFIK